MQTMMGDQMATRRIVLVCEARGERYGNVLDEATQAYAGGFAAHGFATSILDCQAKDFLAEVKRLGADPEVAAFFSAGGKGLHLQTPEGVVTRPFRGATNKPVICQHGDHPFQQWLGPLVRADFPSKFLFFNDPASVDFVARLGLARGRCFYSPPCIFGGDQPAVDQPRDIAVLFVGLLLDPEQARGFLLGEHPDLEPLFDLVNRRGLDESHRPLFDIARDVLRERGDELDLTSRKGQVLLHRCDWWIRQQRRRDYLFGVRRHPVTVVAQKAVPWKHMHPDTRFLPPMPLQEVLRLCDRTQAMLVPQPSYPHGLTERILYAMDRRTAVVTNPSPAIRRYFVPSEELLLAAGGRDVDRQIDKVRDEAARRPMGNRARAAVRRQFMPAQVVAGYLERLRTAGIDI